MTPPAHPCGPGGQQDQEHGGVLHVQGEPPIDVRSGSSQAPQGLSMTPPTHQGGPGGQQDQDHEVVLHDQGEVYQQPIFFMSGSSIYIGVLGLTLSNPGLVSISKGSKIRWRVCHLPRSNS